MKPRWIVATDPAAAARHDWSGLPKETELLTGADGIARVVADPEVDVVLTAIVGMRDCGAVGRHWRRARPWRWPTRRRWSWPVRW